MARVPEGSCTRRALLRGAAAGPAATGTALTATPTPTPALVAPAAFPNWRYVRDAFTGPVVRYNRHRRIHLSRRPWRLRQSRHLPRPLGLHTIGPGARNILWGWSPNGCSGWQFDPNLLVSPSGDGLTDISAAHLLKRNDTAYLAYHGNSGNMYLTEIGWGFIAEAFGEENPLAWGFSATTSTSMHGEEQAEGVGDDAVFASDDLLAGVNALRGRGCVGGGLHALDVDHAGRQMWSASGLGAGRAGPGR
ncbi:hypothetical protein B0E53_00868 [Micromonospora sp. MH33]|nr:hypothetical protein B0E53_00868 [Micromonospora sp. MH33]